MSTFTLLFASLVMGWLATLALVRDVHRLQCRDVLIAACGAAGWAFLGMPFFNLPVWGDYGLRLSAIVQIAVAAFVLLMLANLVRGRGVRAGCPHMHARILARRAADRANRSMSTIAF